MNVLSVTPVCVCVCVRSEEHTSELQSHLNLVCRLLLEKNNIVKTASLFVVLHGAALGHDCTYHTLDALCIQTIHYIISSYLCVCMFSCMFFFLLIRGPQKFPLFPYPRLFL